MCAGIACVNVCMHVRVLCVPPMRAPLIGVMRGLSASLSGDECVVQLHLASVTGSPASAAFTCGRMRTVEAAPAPQERVSVKRSRVAGADAQSWKQGEER